MKAVVYHGVGDIRLDDVAEPTIKEPTAATVRLTASAICGTDLHFVRGTMPGTKERRILGHEGVGVVDEIVTQVEDVADALEAYEQFDRRQPGWLKVALAGVSARA